MEMQLQEIKDILIAIPPPKKKHFMGSSNDQEGGSTNALQEGL